MVNNAGKNDSRTLTGISSDHFIPAAGIDNNEAGSVTNVDEKKDSDLHLSTMQMMTLLLDYSVSVAAVAEAMASRPNSADAQHARVATYTNQVKAYVDRGVKSMQIIYAYVHAGNFR